jgi:hypothetical protein
MLRLTRTRTLTGPLGAGSSSAPLATKKTDDKFFQLYVRNSAAAGDNRLIYARLYLSGGGGGEAARLYTTIESNSAGTAHGAHCSLSFGSSAGKVSGLGVAMRATLEVPNRAIANGTVAALQAEIYMAGTSSDPSATEMALIRAIVAGGDATARAKVTNLMAVTCETGAYNAGKMHATTNSGTIVEALRIVVNGAVRYIPLLSSLVAP